MYDLKFTLNKTMKHWLHTVQTVLSVQIFPLTGIHQSPFLLVRVGCVIGSFRHKVFFLDCTGVICRNGSVSGCIMLGTVRTRCSVGWWMLEWTSSPRIWCPRGLSLCCLTVSKPYERGARTEACVIPLASRSIPLTFIFSILFSLSVIEPFMQKLLMHGYE